MLEELKKYVTDEVEKYLTILDELSLIMPLDKEETNRYINETYKNSLNEMSRVNVDEVDVFPYNKFNITVYSNDHNPPHFHVIVEDWDIRVSIESGDILNVKRIGKNSSPYSFVEKHIKDWLDSKNNISPKMTNRELAMILWKTNNP